MGIGKAKELIFTAKVVLGEEACEIGLVEHVVPQNEDSNAAYLKALEIAKEILDKVCSVLLVGSYSIIIGIFFVCLFVGSSGGCYGKAGHQQWNAGTQTLSCALAAL